MKVTIEKPVERTVTIEMTETEAKNILGFLHCNFAGSGFHNSAPAKLGTALCKALTTELDDPTEIYDDPDVRRGDVESTNNPQEKHLFMVNGVKVGEMK